MLKQVRFEAPTVMSEAKIKKALMIKQITQSYV